MEEITPLLEKIDRYGSEIGYFNYLPLKDLDKSCCTASNTVVIDFDAVKEKICVDLGMVTLKSCDAIKLLSHRIDFIELKGLRQFIERELVNEGNIEQKITEKIVKFDFETKIRESIMLFECFLKRNDSPLASAEMRFFPRIAKNYIIVTDISENENPLEFIDVTLNFLAAASTPIENKIIEAIRTSLDDSTVEGPYYNIQRPMIMNCEHVDIFYAPEDPSQTIQLL